MKKYRKRIGKKERGGHEEGRRIGKKGKLNRFVLEVTAGMYLFLETCDQQIRPFFRLLRAHRRPRFSDEPSSRTTIYQFATYIRHRYVAIYERRLAAERALQLLALSLPLGRGAVGCDRATRITVGSGTKILTDGTDANRSHPTFTSN